MRGLRPLEKTNGKIEFYVLSRSARGLPLDWRCPACERLLTECAYWSRKEKQWHITLTRHHDHSGRSRFPVTLICQYCNHVDGDIKVAFPNYGVRNDYWSFSPREIRAVIEAKPNRKHKIDKNKALQLALYLIADYHSKNLGPGE